MKNIDLHCHPSQKTMLTKNTGPNDIIEFDTSISILTDETAGDILDSQSSLKQLGDGNFKLVFWSIYTLEREVVNISRIGEAIRNEADKDLIDEKFLDKVKNAQINYFDYMKKEWSLMKQESINNTKLNLISDISQLQPDKINIFPSLEGAHAFITSVDEENYVDDTVIDRLKNFLNSEPLSFITLTHFTNQQLFTHCFGLKLMKKKELVGSNFYPTYLSPKGYSDLGEKFLNTCIESNTVIDVKHVSLLGRLNIYEHIKNNHPGYTRVMCSHAGLTGMPFSEFFNDCLVMAEEKPGVNKSKVFENRGHYIVKLVYRRKNGPLGLTFNPQLINLYDDDIRSIIEIGGIIGLSLDQRILGSSTFLDRIGQLLNYHTDYLSLEAFLLLCQRIGMRPEDYLGENYRDRLDEELVTLEDLGLEADRARGVLDWSKKHRRRVAQSIMHIMDVGAQVSDTPWNHIALGSDFDGLIDAVNCCRTSEKVPKFKKSLIKEFKKLEDRRDYIYNISPKDLVRKVFEQNVIDFYKR